MNKFCHTGFSQIQELYNQHVEQIDSALQHCKGNTMYKRYGRRTHSLSVTK